MILHIEFREGAVFFPRRTQPATWRQDVDGFIRSLRGKQAPTRRPSRWLIAAAVIALLLVVGLVGWLVLGRDGEESASREPGSVSPQLGSEVGEVTPTTVLGSCETSGSEWTDLGVTDSTDVGEPGWHFTVVEGQQREDAGLWDVVLTIEGSVDPDTASSQNHYASFYNLVVDGDSYEPHCFSVVDGPPLVDPSQSSTAVVGFYLPDEITDGFVLELDAIELGRGRIDL